MKQEFRYLADRAALNEFALSATPKITKVEMLRPEGEFTLAVTSRQFVDDRQGRKETITDEFSFPCRHTAMEGLKALRSRGGWRFKEIGTHLKP